MSMGLDEQRLNLEERKLLLDEFVARNRSTGGGAAAPKFDEYSQAMNHMLMSAMGEIDKGNYNAAAIKAAIDRAAIVYPNVTQEMKNSVMQAAANTLRNM
jgi:hypothetical protein